MQASRNSSIAGLRHATSSRRTLVQARGVQTGAATKRREHRLEGALGCGVDGVGRVSGIEPEFAHHLVDFLQEIFAHAALPPTLQEAETTGCPRVHRLAAASDLVDLFLFPSSLGWRSSLSATFSQLSAIELEVFRSLVFLLELKSLLLKTFGNDLQFGARVISRVN